MMPARSTGGKFVPILLAALSLAASGMLALHFYRLQSDTGTTTEVIEKLKNHEALATLDNFSLPANRIMTVCNNSGGDVTVSTLTAFYIDSHGTLNDFSSASNQWHTWRIPAGSKQRLDLHDAAHTVWDGSTVFYAMDASRDRKTQLLSGTSEDLKNGCLAISPQMWAEEN
jgi:hypothetical protein